MWATSQEQQAEMKLIESASDEKDTYYWGLLMERNPEFGRWTIADVDDQMRRLEQGLPSKLVKEDECRAIATAKYGIDPMLLRDIRTRLLVRFVRDLLERAHRANRDRFSSDVTLDHIMGPLLGFRRRRLKNPSAKPPFTGAADILTELTLNAERLRCHPSRLITLGDLFHCPACLSHNLRTLVYGPFDIESVINPKVSVWGGPQLRPEHVHCVDCGHRWAEDDIDLGSLPADFEQIDPLEADEDEDL